MARRVVAAAAVWLGLAGCGGSPASAPVPSLPFPVAGTAGRTVALYPLTLLAVADDVPWTPRPMPDAEWRRAADSVIAAFLTAGASEVRWVLPATLRAAAARAPGFLTDPDRMPIAVLRNPALRQVPEPLWSQLRNLTGVAADRYAAVPARLAFLVDSTAGPRAELSMVLIDVRNGVVIWRTVARGGGDDPWTALRSALRTLLPDGP